MLSHMDEVRGGGSSSRGPQQHGRAAGQLQQGRRLHARYGHGSAAQSAAGAALHQPCTGSRQQLGGRVCGWRHARPSNGRSMRRVAPQSPLSPRTVTASRHPVTHTAAPAHVPMCHVPAPCACCPGVRACAQAIDDMMNKDFMYDIALPRLPAR
jgi:hypothetical protein